MFRARVRPLILVRIGPAVFQQFVGTNTVINFATTILGDTGFSTNTAVMFAVFVGLTNFVITMVAVLLMDWVGRRGLLLTGTVILTVALLVLDAYFQFSSLQNGASWLGLVCVIVCIAGFTIGLAADFWLMISETHPLQFRSRPCRWQPLATGPPTSSCRSTPCRRRRRSDAGRPSGSTRRSASLRSSSSGSRCPTPSTTRATILHFV